VKETDKGVEDYVSPRQRELTSGEGEVREIAYKLKESDQQAVETAAAAMAIHVTPLSILVPIPNSKGSTESNLSLANEISRLTGASIVDALYRSEPVESSMSRRLRGESGIEAHQHKMQSRVDFSPSQNVLFIDNVLTTGRTADAARLATKGIGSLLAYAKAEEVLTHSSQQILKVGAMVRDGEVSADTLYQMASTVSIAGDPEQKKMLVAACGMGLYEGKLIKDNVKFQVGPVHSYPYIDQSFPNKGRYTSVRQISAIVKTIKEEQSRRTLLLTSKSLLLDRAKEVGLDPSELKILIQRNFLENTTNLERLKTFMETDFANQEKKNGERKASNIKFTTVKGDDYEEYIAPDIQGMTDKEYEKELRKLNEIMEAGDNVSNKNTEAKGPDFSM
jgi:hypothetical protein